MRSLVTLQVVTTDETNTTAEVVRIVDGLRLRHGIEVLDTIVAIAAGQMIGLAGVAHAEAVLSNVARAMTPGGRA